jgi:tetratricopeptide (TPR) repeat protein
MAEIRVVFDRKADDVFSVHVMITEQTGTIGSLGPFRFVLSDADHADLRWYLEEFLDLPDGGSLTRARRIEQQLEVWGRQLFEAAFDRGESRELVRKLLRIASPELRMVTVCTSDGDILRLPWELLADESGTLASQGVVIRRQLGAVEEHIQYTSTPPLRVLLVVSRPDDTGFIDPRHSSRAVLETLQPLAAIMHIDFCRPPTMDRLEQMLVDAQAAGMPYHIVHFDGHGDYSGEWGQGFLAFERAEPDPKGRFRSDIIMASWLAKRLARFQLPLVILEACRTSLVPRRTLGAVAPRLIREEVRNVIAMGYAVHIEATRLFLAEFYSGLASGYTISGAVERGRAALRERPARWLEVGPLGRTIPLQDWFLPQLYQRGSDPILIHGGSSIGARPDDGPAPPLLTVRRVLGGLPRAPLYGFQGRARELYRLERSLQTERAVLLHAPGGMGKTALATEAASWLTETGLFPNGACFISFERPITAESIAQTLGMYLEGPAFEAMPAEAQVARAIALFQAARVLLIWDNFESILPNFAAGAADVEEPTLYPAEERQRIVELYRQLIAEPQGNGRLLITCRPGEAGLPGAWPMELAGLIRPDSLHLLGRVMFRHGLALDDPRFTREELGELLDLLSDHPLSIELVGPHLVGLTPRQIIDDFAGLLDRFIGEADEERNRSLLKSLRFSTSRLGPRAREALAWLGLFRGGVFETNLLEISQMEPAGWETIRAELVDTALVRTEQEILIDDRPYLRFHPTLEHLHASTAKYSESTRQNFVGVYQILSTKINQSLVGGNPKEGIAVFSLEEMNYRKAIVWAIAADQFDFVERMVDTLCRHMKFVGRLREEDRWIDWLADQARGRKLSIITAAVELKKARSLFGRGQVREAVARLQDVIGRLEPADDFDVSFPLANARSALGRFYCHAGQPERALPILSEAAVAWEGLVMRARASGGSGTAERANLGSTLNDLAEAMRRTAAFDQALATAERALRVQQELGNNREVAADLGQIALILSDQGKYRDADANFETALEAARRVGDRGLEGSLLLNQGILARRQGDLDRAAKCYRSALKLFRESNNDEEVMRVYNLLGVVEQHAGRFPEAKSWHENSYDMSRRRGDKKALGIAALNIGVICQFEAEAALRRGDGAGAKGHFTEAERWLRQSLDFDLELGNPLSEAAARGQLAQLYLLAGELEKAEEFVHQARRIHEAYGSAEVRKEYETLSKIALSRGDCFKAAEWEAKRRAVLEEIDRRARGDPGQSTKQRNGP